MEGGCIAYTTISFYILFLIDICIIFNFFIVMNKTSMSIFIQVFYKHMYLFVIGINLTVELLSHGAGDVYLD